MEDPEKNVVPTPFWPINYSGSALNAIIGLEFCFLFEGNVQVVWGRLCSCVVPPPPPKGSQILESNYINI